VALGRTYFVALASFSVDVPGEVRDSTAHDFGLLLQKLDPLFGFPQLG
jgi:hypothetical protein